MENRLFQARALQKGERQVGFSQVLGQAAVVDNLKKQLEHGKVVHAYLFLGPKGIGKTLLAKIFAQGLLCSATAHPVPTDCADASLSQVDPTTNAPFPGNQVSNGPIFPGPNAETFSPGDPASAHSVPIDSADASSELGGYAAGSATSGPAAVGSSEGSSYDGPGLTDSAAATLSPEGSSSGAASTGAAAVGGADRPCGRCSSCLRFSSGNHPDFLHIQPVKNSISIDAVRDLQRDIAVKPFHRGRKVYLIDDCHLMTVQAQNALLKTLEEPVGHAVILMTADSGSQLLPTVLSRCQQVILKPVSINLLEEYLQKKYKAFPGYISFAAAYSHGIVGKAVEVVENENFQQQREEIIRLIHSILQGDSTSIIKNTEFFVENEDRVFEILDFIILWMRDIIMLKEWPQGALINVDKRNMLAKHAINFTTGCIKYIISIIEETKQLLLSNSNYRLTMEVMLLRIQEVVTCRQW